MEIMCIIRTLYIKELNRVSLSELESKFLALGKVLEKTPNYFGTLVFTDYSRELRSRLAHFV